MRSKATSDLWWKNAVVYCLDVETFLDGNGDGCGDLTGVTDRVDYLAGMGVSCLWLMPFYSSPRRDDGYDISDFYGVDPRLGTHGDLVELIRTAHDRGIRVIADLVMNHTSDQHPWFQAARADRESPFRHFYVWADEKPEEKPGDVVFPDKENSNWAWDEQAGQFYLHRFYSHQPDLNVANAEVRDEIAQVAGFWLEQGLSGFRVDAVPFLIEPVGLPEGSIVDPHELLRDLRAFMSRRNGESILLGEVNLPPSQQREFFGDEGGDELHMVLSFLVNQALYLSLAREQAEPLEQALRRLPPIPDDSQWANFARNHDELSLDKLSKDEREEVFAAFGPDEELQLYGRGLRRRLPTMLGGDERRVRMVYSLMLSLPGTPVLFYGEEIGMAENLDIEGRLSVRAPMQWSGERHGGFSTVQDADSLCRPVVTGDFAPEHVNAAAQRRDPQSLLNWMERLIRRRRECPELGWGRYALVRTGEPAVLAHRCDWDDSTIVAVHNLGGRPVEAELALEEAGELEALVDLLGDEDLRPGRDGSLRVALDAYDHRWYRARRHGQRVAP
ncbi:MAG TPA: alpha-amylase family protein [Solirubrobacteraceae bacterium]|nr:alpha-amylase family protein [Solirubrobacteraceae bacterium]